LTNKNQFKKKNDIKVYDETYHLGLLVVGYCTSFATNCFGFSSKIVDGAPIYH
jgi:hypothetical protein